MSPPGEHAVTMTSAPMIYVDCDIPDGMTLTQWRASRTTPRRGLKARLRWR